MDSLLLTVIISVTCYLVEGCELSSTSSRSELISSSCHTALFHRLEDLVHGATPVAKSPYRVAPSEMQELSEQLQELQDKVLELLRKEKLYAKFTKSEAEKNWEVPLVGSEMDEAHASKYLVDPGADKTYYNLGDMYWCHCAPFEALYGRKCRSPVLWVEIGESSLTGLELVQETTDK
ncbi:hypothetical protein Tco_0397132, partial [Tanacetum coccineum]